MFGVNFVIKSKELNNYHHYHFIIFFAGLDHIYTPNSSFNQFTLYRGNWFTNKLYGIGAIWLYIKKHVSHVSQDLYDTHRAPAADYEKSPESSPFGTRQALATTFMGHIT